MYRIAIVEDTPEDSVRLEQHLARYREEHDVIFQTQMFSDGMSFLEEYKANFDVILMDIEMPHMNGLEAARRLREVDENVCLIFTTNMAKYAIEGYEVRALDFIVKPVEYRNFSIKLQRALEIRKRLQTKELRLNTLNGMQRIQLEDLYYIEVIDHTLLYHTAHGTFEERGSIKQKEELLAQHGFARCNNSFLLNLRYVASISNGRVTVKDRSISIGRTKKKEFLQKLTDFMGEYGL